MPFGAPSPDTLASALGALASGPREVPMDKVRKAISLLEEVREQDSKFARITSMAIHLLKNGDNDLEQFMSREGRS